MILKLKEDLVESDKSKSYSIDQIDISFLKNITAGKNNESLSESTSYADDEDS